MQNAKLSFSDYRKFILGGKAKFTIRNAKNGNRFTYKVTAPKDTDKDNPNVFYVSTLTSSDNDNGYTYIGYIHKNKNSFIHGTKSKISSDAPSVAAFNFVFNELIARNINNVKLEIWHEGKCCRCGRTLTVPESIASGIGPECSSIKQKKIVKRTQTTL